jgi:hypothetical protein
MQSAIELPPRVASAFRLLIPLAILGNVLWYRIKFLLRSKGYEVHWFYGHLGDIPNMVRLIGATSDKEPRVRYIALLVALLGTTGLFLFFMVRLILSHGAA